MAQALINGLIQGLIFASVGVAFALVYATTRTFYLALGAIYTLSPYLLLTALGLDIPMPLAVAAVVSLASLLSLLSEEAIHWPLERRRAPGDIHLIASLGMSLIIVQVTVLIWGSEAQVLRSGIDTVYEVSPIRIGLGQLAGGMLAALTLSIFFLGLRRSEAGLRLRALASNPPLLAVLGHNVRSLRRLVFALSGGLAAVASAATALDAGFDPGVGLRAVLIGAVATIVGGRGSLPGAAAAGIFIGVLRALVVWFVSAQWEDAVTFALLAASMLLLPGGLHSIVSGRNRLESRT